MTWRTQDGVDDAVKRTVGTVHSMVLQNGKNKLEVGMYYLTVSTSGDRLECAVRLYIPARRSPAMHYNWYGIRRESANKLAEQAAGLSWKDAATTLETQQETRKLAGGGNRRFRGEKPVAQERYTQTLDLRSRPVRLLYSRTEHHSDEADEQDGRTRKSRTRGFEPEDVWTRLSRPLAFSTQNSAGRHEGLMAKGLQENKGAKLGVRTQKDNAENRTGSMRFEPTSFGPQNSKQFSPKQQPVVKARPASARPAFAQGSGRFSSYDKIERRRPISAMGRARDSGLTPARAAVAPNRDRPRSAMARIVSKVESTDVVAIAPGSSSGDGGHERRPAENPFGSIVSQDAQQIIKTTAGMSAEQQLLMMKESKASSVLNIFMSTSLQSKAEKEVKKSAEAGRAKELGLMGLLKVHKGEIRHLAEKHGAQYLEETLNRYEEKDIERYKLPFAHVFMEVVSGKNVPRTADNYCDPYVRVALKDSERGQIDEHKTSIEHSKQNPEWKTSMQFKCHNLERDAVFTLACWHHSSFAHVKDVCLGNAVLELRHLKIGVFQEWNLTVQPLVKSKETTKIKLTTFYGKEDAYSEWMKKKQTAAKQAAKAKDSVPEDGRKRKEPAGARQTDSLDALFKKWSRTGKARSGQMVDFKEFTDMLRDLELMPGKIGHHKALEIFRQANRRTDKSAADSNTDELDRHEFYFAVGKVGEFCKVNVELLLINDDPDREQPTQTQPPPPENGTCEAIGSHAREDYEVATEEKLLEIWRSCSPRDWESLGVGEDLFAYLRALQKQEESRPSSQTIDLLQQPPLTGTARFFAPDAETIDLESVNAPGQLLLYIAKYNGTHIKTLRIGGCNQLSLSAVLTFTHKFRFISSLSLQGNARVDDQWLSTLSKALHLQDLFISECIRVTDEGLLSAASASIGLRRLDCSNCIQISDRGVIAVGQHCSLLESLALRGCLKVTNDSILSVLEGCALLAHLNIAGVKACSFSVAKDGLPKLQSLNVSNCKGLDDIALERVARAGTLQSLTAYANGKITDAGLKAVASCTNLTALSLARCPQVSDSGMIQIVMGCRRLRHINIDFCIRVSDTTLTFVADYNVELQQLSLRGCTQISAIGVRCVLKHCPWVTTLDVAHSGADEAEVRHALSALHEKRTRAQREEDVPWLVGKKGTPTWTGIETDDSWLPGPRTVDCQFSNIGVMSACESTKFNARRDLPTHLAIPRMIEEQDLREQQDAIVY